MRRNFLLKKHRTVSISFAAGSCRAGCLFSMLPADAQTLADTTLCQVLSTIDVTNGKRAELSQSYSVREFSMNKHF